MEAAAIMGKQRTFSPERSVQSSARYRTHRAGPTAGLLQLLAVVCSATAAAACGMGAIDLSPLSGRVITFSADTGGVYYLDPCNAVTPFSKCQTPSASVYYLPIPDQCKNVGTSSSSVFRYLDSNDESKGLIADYSNGDPCNLPGGPLFTSTVTYQCDQSVEVSAISGAPQKDRACHQVLVVASKHACPAPKAPLSGGWVFIIILLVVSFVYVVGGCVYLRWRKGTTGCAESCPNYGFWQGLVILNKAGCAFTWKKLRALCSGGDNTGYQQTEGV